MISVFVSNGEGTTWVEVMVATSATSTMTETEIIIDYDSLVGISFGDSLRVKFVVTGTNDKRINIDNVKLYTNSNPE